MSRTGFVYWDDRLRSDDAIEACLMAVRQWGAEPQLNKAAEECSELSAAINRLLNTESERNDIVEEIIDVRLILEVLRTLYPTEQLADQMDEQVANFRRRVAEDSPDGFTEAIDKRGDDG